MIIVIARSRNAGFSLVELLVAVTIGLLLLAGLTMVFVNASEASREMQKASQQIENGRYALDILSNDLHNAGFYGLFHDTLVVENARRTAGAMPDPCELASTAIMLDALALPVQGYRAANLATAADITATTCDDKGLLTSANLRAGSDVIVLRRANSQELPATAVAVNHEVYLQATTVEAEIQFGNGAVVGNNKADGGVSTMFYRTGNVADGTVRAPIFKYHVHIYFVAPCSNGTGTYNGGADTGVCTNSDDSIPTLKRLELVAGTAGPKFKIVPLVEGIEYLKIEYGLDNLPDVPAGVKVENLETKRRDNANVDSYSATPAVPTTTTAADWIDVIAAKIYVLARNTDATGNHSDTKVYALGSVSAGPMNDQFKRHAYTANVRMTNPASRREYP